MSAFHLWQFFNKYKYENSNLLNTAPYPCLSMKTIVRTSNFAKCDLAFVIFSNVTCCFSWLAVVWYIWSLLFFKSHGTHYQLKKNLNVCNESQYFTINCYLAPTQRIKLNEFCLEELPIQYRDNSIISYVPAERPLKRRPQNTCQCRLNTDFFKKSVLVQTTIIYSVCIVVAMLSVFLRIYIIP